MNGQSPLSSTLQSLAKKRVPLVFLFSLLLVLLSLSLNKLPHTTGDVHSLFPGDSKELSNFKNTNALYGNHLSDVVVVNTGSELSLDVREELLEVEDALRALDGIEDVVSPVRAFSKKLKSPLPLRSKTKTTSRFILRIDGTLTDTERGKLNAEIDSVFNEHSDLAASRTGPFYISESVTNAIEKETQKRTPFTLVALFLVASLLLRSAKLSALVLLAPALSVLWTVFGAALLDISLGPVSQLVPPFILAVGASYSIHVATRLLSSPPARLLHTKQELRSAVGIAAATSIVGVMSLYLMDVQGVQEFALLAAVGIFLAANFALFLTPAFVSESKCAEFPLPCFFLKPERKHVLVGLIIGLSIAAGFGVPRIVVHTEPMMFLPESSPERVSIDLATESFPGNRLLSLVFKPESGALTAEQLDVIAALAEKITKFPHVYSTVSDRDFEEISKLRKGMTLSEANGISHAPEDITLEDLSTSRIILETDLEGAELLGLEKKVLALAERELRGSEQTKGALRFYISGIQLLIAQQTNSIVRGIIHSLLFTLLVVSVILLAIFRDVRLLAIGLVPNVIPVLTVLGAIGWIYQDINLGASLVGAAALSIAVDNTFHFLISWKENWNAGKASRTDTMSSVTSSIRQCFPSFMSTSLVLTTGFGIMALSSVLPVQQFGLLLAITLLVGFLADTIVLPYLMSWYETKGINVHSKGVL